MMEKVCTDTLRSSAPNWSLGGDKQLLDLLQNLHKKIITNCTETNTKLDELVNSVDTASIDLQNVNNKFMALSNSQFIERRVYDDDIDVAPEVNAPKEPEKQADPQDELLRIKQSIQVLEATHETVHIVDSDSSDDEDEGRTVLKPKDVYWSRPLPHIIGSDLWRKKWHAGLVVEDSDTESAGSKSEPREEYSDSEPEVTHTQTDKLNAEDGTMTADKASVESGPALVAARLARRLAADAIASPPSPAPRSPPPPPQPARAPLYRPQQPVTATIFPNEPPPLDAVVRGDAGGAEDAGDAGGAGDAGDGESEPEDIFAELHRGSFKPARAPAVVDDLFASVASRARDERNGDQMTKDTKDESPLFDDIPEPELFEKPKETLQAVTKEAGFKKPVGGISLFGSNADSSNIGAAILKRQQPKSSDEDSDTSDNKPLEKHAKTSITEKPVTKTDNTDIVHDKTASSNNKNIIEDLFIKPKTKKTVSNVLKENDVKTEQKTKLDLFDDDLFDDIDDIFTSKVVTKKPDANNKSIFDDDLFSDITIGKKENKDNKEKNIFDSDDELFGEKKVSDSNKAENSKIKQDSDEFLSKNDDEESKYISSNKKIGSERQKSIFDDDSDDDLFNFKSTSKKHSITEDDSGELIDKTKLKDKIVSTQTKSQSIQNLNLPIEQINKSLIGSDETENIASDSKLNNVENLPNKPLNNNVNTNKQNSVSDNDSEEELFSGRNQVITKSEEVIQSRTEFDDVKNQNKGSNIFIEENDKLNELLLNSKKRSDENANIEPDKIVSNITTNKEGLLSKETLNVPGDGKENVGGQTVQVQSPSLFDDDEMDDLFSDKLKKSVEVRENTRDINNKNITDSTRKYTVMDDNLIKSKDESLFCDTPQPPIPILSKHDDNTNNNDEKLYSNDSEITQHLHQDVFISSHIEPSSENSNDSNSDVLTQKGEVTDTPDVIEQSSPFTDIFNDLPPEFEKPKEPKKSKNVNALFDDDSDDEMLFFKKNSDVADEPHSPSYMNERFSLFHDEPPAIEVDFTSKPARPNKNTIIDSSDEMYGDIFNSRSETKQISNTNTVSTNVEITATTRDIFDNDVEKVDKKDLSTSEIKNISEKPEQSLEDSIRSTNAMIASNINKLQTDIKRQNDDETKQKSIGKLKVNFNINVSTLLPGASPKKSKLNEELDGAASSKLPETGLQNSVNFQADKESGILDNKLSKDRAKIQVKRRPSTRRARKEAARKSGIDFGESFDSTDNSSSIDQPEKQCEVTEAKVNTDKDNIAGDINTTKSPLVEDNDKNLKNNDTEVVSESKNMTKVVYILNDEDIFSDANENVKEQNKTDLAKPSPSTDKQNIERHATDNINRSASTDKKVDNNRNSVESNADKSKTSIFDLSDSDSELFGAKTIKVKPKTKLFDSDTDDDDLFGSQKAKAKVFEEKKVKKSVKESLFGDESDDELFATSTKSNEKQRSKPKELSNNAPEMVFEDPLSLLSRDDS